MTGIYSRLELIVQQLERLNDFLDKNFKKYSAATQMNMGQMMEQHEKETRDG